MTNPVVSEEEFIHLWNTLGTATAVAKHLQLNVRSVQSRRRNIEQKHSIRLDSTDPHSIDTKLQDVAPEFPDWQGVEIKNGLMVVFSDAHLVPGTKSTAHRFGVTATSIT